MENDLGATHMTSQEPNGQAPNGSTDPKPAGPGGGLIALAVLNFVFGGIGGVEVIIRLLDQSAADTTLPLPVVLLYALTHALLITSGVGYLVQRRFLGRVLGNGFALCAIGAVIWLLFLDSNLIRVAEMVGAAYALVTLLLINTLYRSVLTR